MPQRAGKIGVDEASDNDERSAAFADTCVVIVAVLVVVAVLFALKTG